MLEVDWYPVENGYIKLFRTLNNKGYYTDSRYVHLWIHLLFKANYKEKEVLWNEKLMTLKPGQLLTGRDKLAMETGIHASSVERILKCFESEQQIEQQKTNKFRIISIVNWNKYQLCEQQIEQPVNNQRTTNEQPANTINKDKKDKNVKKDNKEKKAALSDTQWILSLKNNIAYAGIDVDREYGKCIAWCETNQKIASRRRFINWINRVEKPIGGGNGQGKPLEGNRIPEYKRTEVPIASPAERERGKQVLQQIRLSIETGEVKI